MNLRFFCDESYDSPKAKSTKGSPRLEPKCYVVGGFLANQRTWEKLEKPWFSKNKRMGVDRYHAAHLNAATWEFEGWKKGRRLRYSRFMLGTIKAQKDRIHGISCGMYVDSYRKIITADGQRKMGHPYMVCFKTCIATIAQQMDIGGAPLEDTFSVVLDQGDFQIEAVAAFYGMKNDPAFKYRHRLETCTPGEAVRYAGLQAADYLAYEMFRLMQGKRVGTAEMRASLATLLPTTRLFGQMFDDEALEKFKDASDRAHCDDGKLTVFESDESVARYYKEAYG